MPNAGVAVYRNVFALVVDIDDCEGETHLQTKRAPYAEIRAWVKQNDGLHVSNFAISWTKDRCWLVKTRCKKRKGMCFRTMEKYHRIFWYSCQP